MRVVRQPHFGFTLQEQRLTAGFNNQGARGTWDSVVGLIRPSARGSAVPPVRVVDWARHSTLNCVKVCQWFNGVLILIIVQYIYHTSLGAKRLSKSHSIATVLFPFVSSSPMGKWYSPLYSQYMPRFNHCIPFIFKTVPYNYHAQICPFIHCSVNRSQQFGHISG